MAKWTGIVYDGELLDWGFSWSAALPSGDSVATSTWDVGDDLTVTRETLSSDVTSVWVTGFEGGTTYTLTNHVVTTPSGREFDQSVVLRCVDTGQSGGVTIVDAQWADEEAATWADGEEWVWLE